MERRKSSGDKGRCWSYAAIKPGIALELDAERARKAFLLEGTAP